MVQIHREYGAFWKISKTAAANAIASAILSCYIWILDGANILSQLFWVWEVFENQVRCWKRVSYSVLLQICTLFWSLAKPAQDGLLWAMQSGGFGCGDEKCSSSDSEDSSGSDNEESTKRSRQVKWLLSGTQVCRRSFQRMLGIGCGRLNRTRARFQGIDERTLKGQGLRTRPSLATSSVNTFMFKMYYSISESMPTGILGQFSWLGCFLRLCGFCRLA